MARLLALALLVLSPLPALAAPPIALGKDGTSLVGAIPVVVHGLFAGSGATRRVAVRWRCADDACAELVGDAAAEGMTLALRLAAHADDAAALLSVDGAWTAAGLSTLLAFELELPADAVALVGRDRRLTRASHAFLGRFDPKWLATRRAGQPSAAILVDDDVDGVEVTLAAGRLRVRVELDSVAARPFAHDTRCTRRWRDPNRRVAERLRYHAAGERVSSALQLFAGAAPPVIVVSPWPDGRRAALVFSDHADQSSPPTFAVLAQGFLARDLPLTKALFANGGRQRPQLEDDSVRALADALHAAGSEIIPHSATPEPDDEATMESALTLFERWDARTYIDHQPETNCEAFGNQGFHSRGRWALAPLLAAHSYDYVWIEGDDPAPKLNLFRPGSLGERVHTLYPLGRLDVAAPIDLWLWRSTWAFLPSRQFFAMYAPRRLDQLEAERGLHIAHTYLETFHRPNTTFGRRNLLERRGDQLQLTPGFAAVLDDLAARQRRGTLWVTTVAELADRLRALARLKLRWRSDGRLEVESDVANPGVTFIDAANPGANPEIRALTRGKTSVYTPPQR